MFRREYAVSTLCPSGASVIAGKHASVQAFLRERYIPNAIYVHCYAHKLNLVICDVNKNVPYLLEFSSIISKLHKYFNTSSVTSKTVKHIQQQLSPAIDFIPVEMKDHLSAANMEILRCVSSLSPGSPTVLEVQKSKALCLMLHCDTLLLNNEIQVLKLMLKQSKSKNIVDLYFEILPFQQAFPTILFFSIESMTIPAH
ncbi:unnamed protein product, partial [Rotaria sordida]